jgi:UDP-2,3-diacylglucosamine pyrophosphatase LpxH
LYVDVDAEGEISLGAMYFVGDLFEIMAGRKLIAPPKMLDRINEVLRETAC